MTEQQLQEKQRQRFYEWSKKEGWIEHPTHIETLLKPEQQKRIQWLKEHCSQEKDILDIGCSWGYILNEVQGRCGIDKNPESVELGRRTFPHIQFEIGDVLQGLNIPNKKFAIVIMADLLEHLEWFNGVEKALIEGLRMARDRLLLTLPWKQTPDLALCFKHQWVPTPEKLGFIMAWLMERSRHIQVSCDSNFIYIEVVC